MSRHQTLRRQPLSRLRVLPKLILALTLLFIPLLPGCDHRDRAPAPEPDLLVPHPSLPVPSAPAKPTPVGTPAATSHGPVNRMASVLPSTSSKAPERVDLIAEAENVRDSLRKTLHAVGTLIGAARQQ